MTQPAVEIRWEAAAVPGGCLRIAASMRRADDMVEQPLDSREYTVDDLYDAEQLRPVAGHVKTWITSDPDDWPDDLDPHFDPANIWIDNDRIKMWGELIGRLFVGELLGHRLDRVVEEAAQGAGQPEVRLVFALHGREARRLPVETLIWPGATEQVGLRVGFSLVREAEPADVECSPVDGSLRRVIGAAVVTPGFADAKAWHALEKTLLPASTADTGSLSGLAFGGPGLCGSPRLALDALTPLRAEVAVAWGHGVWQRDGESNAWQSPAGTATAAEIADALSGCADVVMVAMCFSASDGETGEASAVARLAGAGVPVVIGFQGEPATLAATRLVADLIRMLRADNPDLPLLTRVERAVHSVRTRSGDGERAALQMVVQCAPVLMMGRGRRPLPRRRQRTSNSVRLTAFRTAGQLLVTELPDRAIRIPIPVEPLSFTLSMAGSRLALSHHVQALDALVNNKLRALWPAVSGLSLDLTRSTEVDRLGGMLSAMFAAVVDGCEQLTATTRPPSVDVEIGRARARDWGSPSAMELIDVKTGRTICRLAQPIDWVVTRSLQRDVPTPRQSLELFAPSFRPFPTIDWALVNRAVGGDREAVTALMRLQQQSAPAGDVTDGWERLLEQTSEHARPIPTLYDWSEFDGD